MDNLSKPKTVRNAAILIITIPLIGLLKVLADQEFLDSLESLNSIFVVMGVFTIILGFLAYKIWSGRNWARVIYSLMFVLGLIPAIQLLSEELARNPMTFAISVLQIIIQLLAFVLMHLPISNVWYRAVKAEKNA